MNQGDLQLDCICSMRPGEGKTTL